MSNEMAMSGKMNFSDTMSAYLEAIQKALECSVPPSSEQPMALLHEAMRYSLLAGGKRLRALLPMMIVASYQRNPHQALASSCALEMIHTYSLIHDDLPCMDNDDLRRGRPTNHKVYGEAMALLAGDALLTAAFGRLQLGYMDGDFNADVLVRLLGVLAEASGTRGMVGGQVLDMQGLPSDARLEDMQQVHRLKTGALLKASVLMGAITAQAPAEHMDHWCTFGDALGLAFQIQDDILDLIGDEKKMGKKAGRDVKNNKVTYVTLLGLEGARQALRSEYNRMLTELSTLPIDRTHLECLVNRLMEREN